jgi:hypothetical protein
MVARDGYMRAPRGLAATADTAGSLVGQEARSGER